MACPYLTTMIQYYVEGHPRQKHHLANERLGEHRRAYAFRGNVFSYIMPWEMILASASMSTSQDFLKHWPHPPRMVANMIKVLFANTTDEHTLGHLKELHIRSFVLVGLARIYLENGHEDMIRLGCDDVELADEGERKRHALQHYMDRVRHLYPPEIFGDPDDPQANGGILKEVAELSRAAMSKAKVNAPSGETPFEYKNAMGPEPESTEDLSKLFATERAKTIVEDHRGEAMLGSNM